MKKKGYTSERLAELERQAKECSDADLLDEANRLEREMKKYADTDMPSEEFFEQIMMRAKAAEKELE